jgi:hypothetical protein
MSSLKRLFNTDIGGVTMFYDLVMICRDPGYKIDSTNLERLKQLSLLKPDGKPHNILKNVVLSAASGEGLDMELKSPLENE